jgi:23S rRNA (cytosine1962-C5)-methyltransferase
VSTAWLKPGREKSVIRRHPWIFASAVGNVELSSGIDPVGETIEIRDHQNRFLARGAYSPVSQIRIRLWTWDADELIDETFFQRRIATCRGLRDNLFQLSDTDAYRLVHAESDGLPGLVVDRYAQTLVVQCLAAGTEKWRGAIVDCLIDQLGSDAIFERSDADVRGLEGLGERSGLLYGSRDRRLVEMQEAGLRFLVDVAGGQKTGFYLDQRSNRAIVRMLARNRRVLDCFTYTGSFAIAALAGGAQNVISIDSSSGALELARENLALNSLPANAVDWRVGDVFQSLREFRDRGVRFDLIILDPPKFAPTSAQAERAARGYKDINLLALKLLDPGGFLVTFSCSGGIGEALFEKIIAGAALDAKVEAQIIARMHQAADHPVSLNFPEGNYLKGLVLAI